MSDYTVAVAFSQEKCMSYSNIHRESKSHIRLSNNSNKYDPTSLMFGIKSRRLIFMCYLLFCE